jgi:benzylsuccinate CoA-transferase BbsF subunit
MSKLPLAGIRVTDFTWIGAGSYTTKLLADFGADVIKIESATRMDSLRSTAPFKEGVAGINRSGYFADRNTSKRSVRLNLKHPEARTIARDLIAKSDVVANNFTPGTLERFGLGYRDVTSFRPDIIYIAMSMQGGSGPDSKYVGFGLTIAALTGLQYLSGQRDRPPAGTGTNYPDHVPNPCHGAFAVLSALYHRRKTGEGQFIDLAQTEPTIALLGPAMVDYTVNGRIAERCGNDHWYAAPRGAYPCSGTDRWIAISIHTDEHWRAFDALLEITGAQSASRNWSDRTVRLEHRRELDALVGARTCTWDGRELMRALQAEGIPAGVVQNAKDLLEQDEQLAHRKHWISLEHPEMGRTLYNAPPIRLSRTPAELSRPAPLLGEHTEEVCLDLLGMTRDRFERLQAGGVFE